VIFAEAQIMGTTCVDEVGTELVTLPGFEEVPRLAIRRSHQDQWAAGGHAY
jgi:hypothetical protein